ncbi:malonate decarboxylase subunit epsilon [Paenibacillus sp. UNC451MF]|uniref:malonate decarboxylase subunit epsilon n=1 Tax=Paenibacillus sp. UNC451MF TaxID=1449063 RepID=UPI00048ED5AE|nr:malonate decarboxylase subunit epsilon [Paenibacillus sp. UNC451MF]
MTMAFLFPGQGSQYPTMLHQLPDHHVVRETIEEASCILNTNILEYDTEENLASTVGVQLALLLSGVAMARALINWGGLPSFVAGHSIGAFGAAVISGVLTFRDALHLVQLRATLMKQAFPYGYGMGVIVGLGPMLVQQLVVRNASSADPVYIANINASHQVTVAGTITGIRRVLDSAQGLGARKAELLRVAVPSHCPLMESVASNLENTIRSVSLKEPQVPYIANTTARLLRTSEAIREDLIKSIAKPVQWHDMTKQLYERGARLFVEMPPGLVLSSLVRSSYPSARAVAISDTGVDSLLYLIKQEQDRNELGN